MDHGTASISVSEDSAPSNWHAVVWPHLYNLIDHDSCDDFEGNLWLNLEDVELPLNNDLNVSIGCT